MNVLLIGAHGYLGPHVVEALAPDHHLRITDIKPAAPAFREKYSRHEFRDLDIASAADVMDAAQGMDAIINLSVVRHDPLLAFQVNTQGCYNMMQAAVQYRIRRVINTGPHFTVAGPSYEQYDFAISPDVPPHPGIGLYPLSKSLGQEICQAFTREHDIYVQDYLFYSFREAAELEPSSGGVPFVITWSDAAQVFRSGLDIAFEDLPSKCEVFFICADSPQQKFLNQKAKDILGFVDQHDVSILWRQS